MPRTNDRTARRTAVIGQKGPLFVVTDDNDNSYYGWSLQPGQNTKKSAQGQHRIARTGYPGQDNRTGCLAKTVRKIIIGSQKLDNDN
jgi:hypothetical protein